MKHDVSPQVRCMMLERENGFLREEAHKMAQVAMASQAEVNTLRLELEEYHKAEQPSLDLTATTDVADTP